MDDDLSISNYLTNDHSRTIIHVDMDYYYAQVEEILNPNLKNKPLGVKQRNSVVTSNYIARKYGIKKMMTINDAKQLCPQLVLINGEDLTKYKKMSSKIFDILLNYTPLVEKLGLDENYLDVSELVNQRILQKNKPKYHRNNGDIEEEHHTDYSEVDEDEDNEKIEGCIYPLNGSLKQCNCGCAKRLAIATYIAKDIRNELYNKLKITCSAGISYNKLLAKLIGNVNKPNNQTVLVSTCKDDFMRELNLIKKIPGIGTKTELLLNDIGVKTITDLQNIDINLLKKKFNNEMAIKLKELSFGNDYTQIKQTGRPKSIGLEDSCSQISVRKDVEEKFRLLLMRLVSQVAEDGRIPITIKIILRKYDTVKKTSHRETKQANILPSLFRFYNNQIVLEDDGQDKLLKLIMKLFERIIDMNKPFNITLLGLAFSKFQERKSGTSSIANYLIKKTDLEVQSITNLKSNGNIDGNCLECTKPLADDYYRRRNTLPQPIPMHVDSMESLTSDISDFSETEIEPSPKKTRLGLLIAKRRCISSINDPNDIASPSKLRVAELRLNSRDSEKDFGPLTSPTSTELNHDISNSNSNNSIDDNNCDYNGSYCHQQQQQNYYHSIPIEENYDNSCNCYDNNTIINKRSVTSSSSSLSAAPAATTITGNLANIPCPTGVDPIIFKELPIDVQNELISSWRNSLAVKANGTTTTSITAAAAASASANSTASGSGGGGATATTGAASNTLHRYFIRNN